MKDPLLQEAEAKVKTRFEFYIVVGCSLFLILLLLYAGYGKPEKTNVLITFISIIVALNLLLAYSLWGKKRTKKTWKEKAIEKEYLKLKEREYESLNEKEMLELKELEKRYDDRDFV